MKKTIQSILNKMTREKVRRRFPFSQSGPERVGGKREQEYQDDAAGGCVRVAS